MARIRIAKATSGAAFVSKKKAAEARLSAQEAGQDSDEGPDDIFELQHHHLLRCLEKTTVSHFELTSDDEFKLGQIRFLEYGVNRMHAFVLFCRTANLWN